MEHYFCMPFLVLEFVSEDVGGPCFDRDKSG